MANSTTACIFKENLEATPQRFFFLDRVCFTLKMLRAIGFAIAFQNEFPVFYIQGWYSVQPHFLNKFTPHSIPNQNKSAPDHGAANSDANTRRDTSTQL